MAKRPKTQPRRTARPAPKTAARSRKAPAGKSTKASSRRQVTAKAKTTPKKAKPAPAKARKAAAKTSAKPSATRATRVAAPKSKPTAAAAKAPAPAPRKRPFLDRERRIVTDETLRTPPSSLDLDRHSSAARSGRAVLRRNQREHTGMSPELTSGDADVDLEQAYFSGEEAPGGDNPTPDQNVVDEIGKALGVQYQDGEELQASDKVVERDEHRWELDPASSEDYRDRNER